MGEQRGYTCDGGCGNSLVLLRSNDSLAAHSWFVTFTPDGWPTLHTCSSDCLVRVLDPANARALAR